MSELSLPDGFDFRGIYCYRSKDDPLTFIYLPGEPASEQDAMGRSTLSLWVNDQGGILQLGAHWGGDAALLEDLRKYLGERFPELQLALIRLSPAPVSIEGVTLAVGDGAGNLTALKTLSSSGYPPYTTIFNQQLTTEQRTTVTAALHGRLGFLTITYRSSLPIEVSVKTSIAGDVRTDVAELGAISSPTQADSRARIEAALSEGRLKLEHLEINGVPDDLRARADELAKEKAAALLLRMAWETRTDLDESHLEATALLTQSLPLAIERTTDVGSWFADDTGANHLHVMPTSIKDSGGEPTSLPSKGGNTATPVEAKNTVRLGFDAKDAPIAFIQLTYDEATAALRGPDFAPISLPTTKAGASLVVKTNYTNGGPSFEARLQAPTSEGWVLAPKDVGIAKVVVDGTALQKAQASNARVHVRYQPSGKGSSDDRTIYLRHEDWIASWYIVTRSTDLGGHLEFEWKETTANGTVIRHDPVTTDQTELKL